jgi:hypothetical protein
MMQYASQINNSPRYISIPTLIFEINLRQNGKIMLSHYFIETFHSLGDPSCLPL